jgi:hypothetical protein
MENFDFDSLPPHEQSLIKLIGSINGTCTMDAMGMEKACSIRFDHTNFPKLKAVSNLSGNSLNIIANEVVRVGFGTIMANMSDEEIKILLNEADSVMKEWQLESKKDGK